MLYLPRMEKKKIESKNAPVAIGPYSQAILAGNMIFTAGQIPLAADGSDLTSAPIEEQTKQVLENLKGILESAGSSLQKVIKTTVFMKDLNEFSAMNKVYAKYFNETPPARSTVQVSGLPKNAKIEIETVAIL